MNLSGRQIIASELRPASARRFAVANPATGAVLEPQFCEATRDDVAFAANAASGAFDLYRKLPLAQRAAFIEGIGEQLMAIGEALIDRAHEETALPRPRLEGELLRTVNQLQLFAQQVRLGSYFEARIDRAQPERLPLPKPDLRAMQMPLGPVAVFGASNFPLAFSVAGGDTASALAAGCPVVVKGHPAHPGTSELAGLAVLRAIQDNNVPPGVFSLLQAKSTDTGAALVKHPLIKAVAFTGSLAGGRALFDLACSRTEPIPVYAEMGSVNPVFFLPQIIRAEGPLLARALVDSLTLGVGQFCTAPGLVLVIKDASTEAFLREIETCLAAKPPGVMLHEDIKRNFLAGLHKRSLVDGVERLDRTSPLLDPCLVAPALLQVNAKTLFDNPSLAEEVFGPAAVIVVCDSRAAMLAAAENLQGQLTASLHGTRMELDAFRDLLSILERKAGRLILNGFPTGVEVCAAMHHGGPYPATTDSRSTSVGIEAMKRFLRPVSYQNFPQELLPAPLRDQNRQNLWRLVDGCMHRDDL